MADQEQAQGRKPRSRRDRPCDICRRQKHLCIIPIKGEPCNDCRVRKRNCTFTLPPTSRKRRPKEGSNFRQGRGEEMDGDSKTPEPNTSAPDSSSALISDNGRHGGTINRNPGSASSGQKGEMPLRLNFEHAEPQFDENRSPVHSESNLPIAHPPSLDLEGGDENESHYLGSGVFSGLTLREISANSGTSSGTNFQFRQVSFDPRQPAYFVKSKSFMYGRGPTTGKTAFEAVCRESVVAGSDIPTKALSILQRTVLPALPFINATRLETACLGVGDCGPIPYALLAGIIAHSSPYITEMRAIHKTVWSHALLALEDEYRQPRLQTLQLALLAFSARPIYTENAGQSDIGLARAIGAAHLLGLHMEPSNWDLPLWEKSVRKRIWWTLLIHDKWRAVMYGRPSNLHRLYHNVVLPTVTDGDWGKYASPAVQLSLETFVATCRLTLIIDRILEKFYTAHAPLSLGVVSRIGELETIRGDLHEFENSLSPIMRWDAKADTALTTLPTGIRSMQLSYMGLDVIINRLMVETMGELSDWQNSIVVRSAVGSCMRTVNFVLALSGADRESFWMPYSSLHISNSACLLVRIAIQSKSTDADLVAESIRSVILVTEGLLSMYQESAWDVAESALKWMTAILSAACHQLPELKESARAVARALDIPMNSDDISVEEAFSSSDLNFDPMAWLGNDVSWLSADIFNGIPGPESSIEGMQAPMF